MNVIVSHVIALDDRTVKEVFKQELIRLCGGPDIYMTSEGVVMEEFDTRGSGYSERVKKTTELQLAALKLKEALK